MENNENFVTLTENTEQTAEQTPVKTYTQEEVDAIVGKRNARTEAKIRKEYERKYGTLMDTLEAGTGKKGVDEVNDAFQKFYASKGLKMPEKPSYTEKDIEILAKAEANEYIQNGIEDVLDEAERLQKVGTNRTQREEAVYKVLSQHLMEMDKAKQLTELGATEDVYTSKEFRDFASQFNSTTPIKNIYEIYQKTHKKEVHTIGSMKSSNSGDVVVKDFYSPDEARKFTNKDYDKIPGLYEAVVKSMSKWRK
jgi:hypothetical protein